MRKISINHRSDKSEPKDVAKILINKLVNMINTIRRISPMI